MADALLNFLLEQYPVLIWIIIGAALSGFAFWYHYTHVKPTKQESSQNKDKIENLPCATHLDTINRHAIDFAKIETTLTFMQKSFDALNMNVQSLSNRGGLTQTKSPLSITESGYEIVKKLGIVQMISANWQNINHDIEENIGSRNPYDIQQFCIEQSVVYPQKFLPESGLDKIKTEAYMQGLPLMEYMKVVAVLVRDRYFAEHHIDLEEVDKHDPNISTTTELI